MSVTKQRDDDVLRDMKARLAHVLAQLDDPTTVLVQPPAISGNREVVRDALSNRVQHVLLAEKLREELDRLG